jgi:hypothetical protein
VHASDRSEMMQIAHAAAFSIQRITGPLLIDSSMDRSTPWRNLFEQELISNSSDNALYNTSSAWQKAVLATLMHQQPHHTSHIHHANQSQQLKQQQPDKHWGQVDMLYLSGANLLFKDQRVVLPPKCPTDEHTPYLGRVVHAPRQVAWFRRLPRAMPNESWVEVTHCAGSVYERKGYWTYAARGSGLYVNIGRTIAFASHEDAVVFFWGRKCRGPRWCGGEPVNSCLMQCGSELPLIMDEAKQRGFKSVQFIEHCDMRCGACGHEIVLVAIDGRAACSAAIEYRQGANASLPCDCIASPTLTSERGMCATCRRSVRESLA